MLASPDGPSGRRNGFVPSVGVMSVLGAIAETCSSVHQPGFIVIVAGFQKIDDTPPDPAATPANDIPCPVALCSRIANAPA